MSQTCARSAAQVVALTTLVLEDVVPLVPSAAGRATLRGYSCPAPHAGGYAERCRHHFARGGHCQQEVTGGCARGLALSLALRGKLVLQGTLRGQPLLPAPGHAVQGAADTNSVPLSRAQRVRVPVQTVLQPWPNLALTHDCAQPRRKKNAGRLDGKGLSLRIVPSRRWPP